MKVWPAGKESQRSIDSNSQTDYREKLEAELKELRESEMWQAGKTVRSLSPENQTAPAPAKSGKSSKLEAENSNAHEYAKHTTELMSLLSRTGLDCFQAAERLKKVVIRTPLSSIIIFRENIECNVY